MAGGTNQSKPDPEPNPMPSRGMTSSEWGQGLHATSAATGTDVSAAGGEFSLLGETELALKGLGGQSLAVCDPV